MSTLTYSHASPAGTEAGHIETAHRKAIWRRVYDGLIAAQQRRAEREIAAYLARHGGLLTDDMEREIMRRLSGDTRRCV